MSRAMAKSAFLLLLIMVLFYWKILFTGQFSLLTESEGVNQAYAWYDYWVSALRQGAFPLWDPYTFSGHPFAGEMQTAIFYPLNVLLALVPFNHDGVLSPRWYQAYVVLGHFLAAGFMFALVRELGLSRLSALIGGVCFSLGGFVAWIGWPHMLESSIWLPLIFLFLLRAFRAETVRGALLNASGSGLCLGLSILAGGLHLVMMQGLVIVSAVAFLAFYPEYRPASLPQHWKPWVWAALVIGVAAAAGFAAGAVQLLPSVEYSTRAVRWFGASVLPAAQKIPYEISIEKVSPHGVMMFLLFFAFNGNAGVGEVWNPYMGVFPLLLAVMGIRRHWDNVCVRYMAGLTVAAFLVSLGSVSFLHGLLYMFVPYLWMAREATRFLYLASFAMAILAAFGAETLFAAAAQSASWPSLDRVLNWVVAAGAVALAIPAVFGHPEIHPWNSFSILMIFASYGLFRYITAGHNGRFARFLAVALILFDLNSFDWTARNTTEAARTGTDQLQRLLSCRAAAAFLKSQPGPFRVEVQASAPPNIGDVFGIQTTGGGAVTMLQDYNRFRDRAAHATDLLNVRYFLRPASAPEPGPVYMDAAWKIYGNAQAYPRAWVVHETETEASPGKLIDRLGAPGMDPRRVALLSAPLDVGLEPVRGVDREDAIFEVYQPNKLEVAVHAQSRGLLVLSENFYPGWQASVNGRPARIYEVDGALRGVVVNAGENRVTLRYAPRSVHVGAVLTLATFGGVLLAFILHGRHARQLSA